MGGIICIDFIDMAKREHNKELTTAMKEAMKGDKAKHNILAPSRFGVVEMTRQRVRPVADMKTSEACPTCQGTGAVQASILITDTIESAIHQAIEKEAHKRLTVMMHPIIEATSSRAGSTASCASGNAPTASRSTSSPIRPWRYWNSTSITPRASSWSEPQTRPNSFG